MKRVVLEPLGRPWRREQTWAVRVGALFLLSFWGLVVFRTTMWVIKEIHNAS